MNGKILAIIAVAVAVIAGSISAVIVTTKRADAARSQAQAAASKEDAAHAKLKEAEKLESAEKAKLATAEREAANIQEKKALLEAEAKEMEAKANLAAEERRIAEAKADEAEELKRRAEIERQTQQLKLKVADMTNKTLVAAVRAAEAKAIAEEKRVQAEKLKNEREVALIKAKDLKKINFEEWERQLVEWKRNLEERERAIAPEKTVADLEWVGQGEDSVLDEKGKVVRQPKKKYLAENDHTLSPATRAHAREMRIRNESSNAHRTEARDAIVKSLAKLYEAALKADQPQDAEYYRKSIKEMYPDWKYVPATNATAKAEGASSTNVTAKAEGGDSNVGK